MTALERAAPALPAESAGAQLTRKLEQARTLLAEAKTLAELRQVEGFSRAVIEWARRQEELSLAARNEAAFLWLEARASQGEMLTRMEKAPAGRPKIDAPVASISLGLPTLRDLGYPLKEAQRLQLIAAVAPGQRRELLDRANADGQRLTQRLLMAAAPARLTPVPNHTAAPADPIAPSGENAGLLNTVMTGDARLLSAQIPDGSVALCCCDPVYDRFDDYEWLAKECERVLVPGGSLIVQCGNSRRFEVEVALRRSGLTYVDLLAEVYPYGLCRLFKAKVFVGWKPHLWFSRGPRKSGWVMNRAVVGGKQQADAAKVVHPWGDGEQFIGGLLGKLCEPGEVVWDPFTGSGTVPIVARKLGLDFIAFEIDPESAAGARRRLAGVAIPTVERAPTLFDAVEGTGQEPAPPTDEKGGRRGNAET